MLRNHDAIATVAVKDLERARDFYEGTLQLKLTPLSVSPNEKLWVVSLLGSFGWAVIVGAGGAVVSIVHVSLAGLLALPAESTALTWKA